MGREAQGQSCPGLALARPPGGEGRPSESSSVPPFGQTVSEGEGV